MGIILTVDCQGIRFNFCPTMVICEEHAARKIKFGFSELHLTAGHIEKVIGSTDIAGRNYLLSVITKLLDESEEIADIRAEYKVFRNIGMDDDTRNIYIGDVQFSVGKIIYPRLRRSDCLALFLCTAGHEIGRRSAAAMKEGDLLEGYIYDVIGSEVAEKATDLLQEELERYAAESGMKLTNRYSPGYCGWNVAEQHKLFSFYPYNFCGIDLTPSALMNPVKSVSGIIGVGPDVKKTDYGCKICDMEDCIYRNSRHR